MGVIYLSAQELEDSVSTTRVEIIQSENSIFYRENGNELDSLRGNVIIKHDSTYMYCDTAVIVDRTHITAFGEVSILTGDTLSMFCDSLVYKSDNKKAKMFGRVILENGDENLRTQQLDYDLETETATFNKETTLSKGNTILRSKTGRYISNQNKAYFYNSVEVIDSNFLLKTDTLVYSRDKEQADFKGPTRVKQKDAEVYCEDGFYNLKEDYAKFEQNAQYVQDSTRAEADAIFYESKKDEVLLEGNAKLVVGTTHAKASQILYNEKTEMAYLTGNAEIDNGEKIMTSDFIEYDKSNERISTQGISEISDSTSYLKADGLGYTEDGSSLAEGNVEYIDKEANLTMLSDYMVENQENESTTLIGADLRPLMKFQVDTSFIYISADTFNIASDSTGAGKILYAYRNVKILGDDVQAVCDSLEYSSLDSLFILYKDPFVFANTSQFSGDTIFLQMKNNSIDRVDIHQNAMIISEQVEEVFDQIKGKIVNSFFEDGDIDHMEVRGSSQSIYFVADEEDAYIGANQSECSNMNLHFLEGELDEMIFLDDPTSELTPIEKVVHSNFRLPGFNWDDTLRPMDAAIIRQR